jgi:leader peptidase (prepilin peptidase)/N-methyltransferase
VLRWAYPAAITLAAALAAWWLGRRRYRIAEDTIHRTLPAWLLPVVAAVAAVVAAPFYLGRPPVVVITYGAALVWGLVLAWIDLDVRRLPDFLTLPAYPVAAGLLAWCSAATGDREALLRAAACAGLAVLVFFLAALFSPGAEGLGLGDVKLAGTLGGLLGWWSWSTALYGLVTGFVLGGLVAAALLVSRRADRRSYLSFGPALIAGAYVWGALGPLANSG